MVEMWTGYADQVRTYYVRNFLAHRCTVERPSGTGSSAGWATVATSVPCRFGSTNPEDWGLAPGALLGKIKYQVRFAADQDVQQGDRVTATFGATTGRLMVRGVRPAGAYDPARIVLAESVT